MEEILSIRIKGDTSELEQGSTRSVLSLDTLAAALAKTESKVNSFSSALKAYGANAGVVQRTSQQISASLQAMAKSGNVKIEPVLSLDKLKMPDVSFDPIRILLEPSIKTADAIADVRNLQNTLQAQVKPLTVSTQTDAAKITEQLQQATRAVQLHIDTSEANDRVQRLEQAITNLQAEIAQKKAVLPLLTDTASLDTAKADVLGLEKELARLQQRLGQIKPLSVDANIDVNTTAATQKIATLQSAVVNLQNEIAGRKEVLALETDASKLLKGKEAIQILETELAQLQAQIDALQPVVKISAEVEKVTLPSFAPVAVKVPVEVEKFNLPSIPVQPLQIPVDGNLEPIKAKLDEVAKPVELKISSDEATAEIKQLAATIETLEAKLGAKKEFIRIETDPGKLAQTNREIEQLEKEIGRLKNVGKAGFDDFGRRVDKFGTTMAKVPRKAGDATNALHNLSLIAGDASYGFIGIANNIQPAVESLQQLVKESGSVSGAVKNIGASMLGGGGLVLALNVATSLLITFGDKLFSASSKTSLLGRALRDAAKGAGESTAHLELIRAKLTDLNTSQSDRVKLAKEYNETADKANQIDLDQINNIGQVNTAITKQIELLAERAKARAAEAILAEKYEKLFAAQANLETNFSFASEGRLKQLTEAADRTINEAFKKQGIVKPQNLNTKELLAFADVDEATLRRLAQNNSFLRVLFDQRTKNTLQAIGKQIQSIQNYRKGVEGMGSGVTLAMKDIEAAQQDVNEALATFNGLFDASDLLTGGSGRSDKDLKKKFDFFFKDFDEIPGLLLEKLRGINETDIDLSPLQTRLFSELSKMAETAKDFAAKNFNVFEGLDKVLFASGDKATVEAGVKFWNDVKAGLIRLKPQKIDAGALTVSIPEIKVQMPGNLQNIFHDAFQEDDLHLKELAQSSAAEILDYFRTKYAQIGAKLPKAIDVANPTNGLKVSTDLDLVTNNGDLLKGLQDLFDKLRNKIISGKEQLNEDINSALQGIAVQGFVTLGESIAAAISGNDISDAFKNLGSYIGDALKKLGEQMILLSPLIQGIKVAISTFSPELLLPAGIGLTALGSIIKNMFASALPGHKDGLDYVPYDNYLSRLHKGEMVLTAEEAKAYRNAAKSNIHHTGLNVGKPNLSPVSVVSPVNIYGDLSLRGNDLMLQFNRAERRKRRTS